MMLKIQDNFRYAYYIVEKKTQKDAHNLITGKRMRKA